MDCFLKLLLSAVLGAGMLAANAAGPAPANHPLVGTWSWVTFGGNCTETLQYRANQTLLSTSGQEVAEKRYEVSVTPDVKGFYKLTETVLRQNDKKDCAGALLDGPGEQVVRFIQFSPQRDKMLVCESAALTACFGPLTKVRE